MVIPPTRATDEKPGRASPPGCETRANGSPTCALSAPPTSAASAGWLELAARHGVTLLRAGMSEILDYAERRPGRSSRSFPTASHRAEDVLEDDARGRAQTSACVVSARVDGERLTLDFTGTDPQVEGNLNCPLPVTKSAAFFAIRALTDPDSLPSAGAFRPIEVIAPAGCLLNARPPGRGRGRQRRDLEPGRRPGDRRAVGGHRCARPGPGDDEQPHPGGRSLDVLRDARGRPGSVSRTPTGRAPSTSRCRTP